jgi:hypothetical protein
MRARTPACASAETHTRRLSPKLEVSNRGEATARPALSPACSKPHGNVSRNYCRFASKISPNTGTCG